MERVFKELDHTVLKTGDINIKDTREFTDALKSMRLVFDSPSLLRSVRRHLESLDDEQLREFVTEFNLLEFERSLVELITDYVDRKVR